MTIEKRVSEPFESSRGGRHSGILTEGSICDSVTLSPTFVHVM